MDDPGSAGRRSDRFWFTVLMATVTLLVGASVAVGGFLSSGEPDNVVRDYFAALARGDAAAALGYGDVPAEPKHDLLTPEVLAAQRQVAAPTDLVVLRVDRHGDTADVQVRYGLPFASGRQDVTDTVPVVRRGSRWRLHQSAVPTEVTTGDGVERATIAGAQVPSGQYALFPGALPVRYDTPNLEQIDSGRVVKFVKGDVVVIAAQVSAAGRKAIAPLVDQAWADCLAGHGKQQSLCPTPHPTSAVPGSLQGKLTAQPSKTMSYKVQTRDGEIVVEGSAAVDASYTDLDSNNMPKPTKTGTVVFDAHFPSTGSLQLTWGR